MSIPPPDGPDPRLALRPVVTLSYDDDRLVVAWTPIELAYGYRIVVTAGDGFEYRAEATQSPLTCDFVPGRGIAYAVVVEAVGMPSESVTLTTPDALLILRAQRDRLVATRTPEGVHTFGPAVVAEDDVRTLIGGYRLTAAADPVLDEAALTLTVAGTSTDLAAVEAPAVLVFTVSPDYLLRATWTAKPGDDYRLADTFESLQGGDYAYLGLAGPMFVATTFAHRDPEIFFELEPGLSFQAGVAGTPTRVGGRLTVDADGEPGFTWAGESPLGAVAIQPIGQPALALTGGLVTLTPEELLISGSVLLGQVSAGAELDFPTFVTPSPALRIPRPPLAGTTATALLAAIGLDEAVGDRLPAGLLTLAGASVRELTIVAAPDRSEPTVTVLTLDFSGDWEIAAGLSLGHFRLEATVRQADGFPPSTGVVVSGKLDLGSVSYDIEAGAFAESPWYLEIDRAAAVEAADLTKLAGDMTTATATSVLPASLFAGFPLTVTHAAVLADPVAATVVEVEFTIAQTTAWQIAQILTVRDWAATISIAKDKTGQWQPTALLSGTVTIGGAGFAVSVSAPPGDELWTLSLEEGSEIRLPSLSSLLALLGGDAHLPGGLGNLGDLTITDFRIALDQGLTAVAFLFVRIEQSTDWIVIPGTGTGTDLLKLQDFAASLSVAPDGSAGFLQGTLVVGGMPVDAGLVKNGPGEDWMLRAAYTDRIKVPGWNTLEGWLAPSAAGASLPSGMPLADGFELTRVWLRFTDANGVLTALGFTLYAAKLWSVGDGRFELSQVRGELAMPWPIRAETIVAQLGAVLTLGGVDIGIAAVKPGENLPWEFSGSLLNGLTIDLIAAARSVDSVTGLRLPSDALANGLPESITIESAALRVVPDTGELHFAGVVGTDWTITIAETDFAVTSFGGAVDIAATGAPMVARVTGTFSFATVVAKISLLLGTVDTPTILTGVVEPDDLDDVDLGAVTAMGERPGPGPPLCRATCPRWGSPGSRSRST
ncbi:hypothetical protein [Nonomuraea endophytica]|uniref:hypothetical protein n=1 Tax=Nonomuraea endophytica TaxID=714136 RepID=UPI0037CC8C31